MMRDASVKQIDCLENMVKNFKLQSLGERDFEDFYYDGTMKIRMGNNNDPMRRLFEDCTLQIGKNAHLLAGYAGCGKSTEKARAVLVFLPEMRKQNGKEINCRKYLQSLRRKSPIQQYIIHYQRW